jgi:transcription initiation factor TFIID TATA-box-binding protein
MEMKIASTMGSGSLGRELDLRPLVNELVARVENSPDTNFTSEGMVTLYFGEDSPAYTLYRTGTFQIRGAKTETDLEEAESHLRTVLSDVGVEMPDYEFRHVTSVFVGTFDVDVNLEALTIALGLENTEYEPEQFPAVIYRPPAFALTLLIFSTGKVIVGGTTDHKEAESALSYLKDEITALNSA